VDVKLKEQLVQIEGTGMLFLEEKVVVF